MGGNPVPLMKHIRPATAAVAPGGDLIVTVGRRLYVSNLAFATSWQSLKDHFAQAGNVLYANVMAGPDGRSKGCALSF